MAEERIQRRLAAIMAADVVGYSRLMGEDETGTLTALKELRASVIDPTIAEYRGRIVKLMGDGALVEFPSVVDAVECAVSIQRSVLERNADVLDSKRIEFRIGINLGDIIIDGDDIYGDGVNVAARLEGLAEPGGVCLSASVHEQVRTKLDVAFTDMGAQRVKNIAEPVRIYRVTTGATADIPGEVLPLPEKPSIAVLPFDNMSGDPEQEYFADGMAEDLITDLSKISSLSVAARNSSFSFKGKMPNVADVVATLGVAFVLEGSVRKMGDRLRINAQLIDGADGRHIWAERYDGDMAEIFEFQDAIREQIVAALQVSLTPADKALAERKPTNSVAAYDLFLKGRANLNRLSRETVLEAIDSLEEAIEIDPNFADAYGMLSFCLFIGWAFLFPGFDDGLDRAYEMAEKGVELDGASSIALARHGWNQTFMRQHDQSIASFEKAIALAPNDAELHATFGQCLNYWGDPERGLEMIEKGFRMDPLHPPGWDFQLAHSYLLLGRLDEALASYRFVLEWAPKFVPCYLFLASTCVEMDRLDDARGAIKSALEINPRYTVEEVAKIWSIYQNIEVGEHFLDNLRKAGLPEDTDALAGTGTLPDKPSIAVLPFDNMSGDPEQEYFSDGMAEDLITDISNISGLFVVARNSSFAFKGQAIDVKEVAAKLGVKHILEGSVRKMGSKLRVNAQLIDAASGGHIWAQRYDGNMSEIFDFQDNIREQIVSALEVRLTPTDRALVERKPTNNVEAYDLFLKGRANFYRFTPVHLPEAMKCLEEAIEIDPKFADAYGYLSYCHFSGWVQMYPDFDDGLDRANELAERGAALDGTSAIALTRLGWIQAYLRRYDQGVTNLEKAIALAPNNAEIHAAFGQVLNFRGNPERGLELIEKALSLDTLAPPLWEFYAGISHLFLHQYSQSLTRFKRVVEQTPKFVPGYAYLACTYVALDRLDEARGAIETLLGIAPQYTVEKAKNRNPYRVEEASNRYLDCLRKAGLPEG